MLSRGERCPDPIRSAAGGARVEIDRDAGIADAVAIGAPFEPAIRRRQRCELCRITAEQNRLGHKAIAVGERKPTLVAHRDQRAQVLGGAEASSGALDNDAYRACRHIIDAVAGWGGGLGSCGLRYRSS